MKTNRQTIIERLEAAALETAMGQLTGVAPPTVDELDALKLGILAGVHETLKAVEDGVIHCALKEKTN